MDVLLNISGFVAYIHRIFLTNGVLTFMCFGLYFESLLMANRKQFCTDI